MYRHFQTTVGQLHPCNRPFYQRAHPYPPPEAAVSNLSRSAQRANRTARALKGGERVFELLRSDESRKLIRQAAEQGVPPIRAVSGLLVQHFGAGHFAATKQRQFVGMAVKSILEEEGFTLDRPRVKFSNDPLFHSGSTYRPADKVGSRATEARTGEGQYDILGRILRGLTADEAAWAAEFLRRRLRKK